MSRGICPGCGREMQVRIDGAIRSHRGFHDDCCPGSGRAPDSPMPDNPHVAVLDETASEWLRVIALNQGLTLSEALNYAICDWLRLPLPRTHPLAEEAS